MKNYSYQIIFNALSQFASKLGAMILALITIKILTEFGKEFYGTYLICYEIFAFSGILADAGLFAIALREMTHVIHNKALTETEKKTQESFIFGNILSMRLVLLFSIFFLTIIIVQLIPIYSSTIKIGIFITGISMILTMIASTLSSTLQAHMKIQYFSLSLFLSKLFLALFIFIIAQNYLSFFSDNYFLFTLLIAGVFANFILTILVYFFVQKNIKISLNFNLNWWKKILKESLPYGLALILQTLYLRSDLLLISILLGEVATATYGLPAKILESVMVFAVFFGQAILPKLSAQESNKEKSIDTILWGCEKLLLFSIPIIIGTLFFAKELILLISSDEFLSKNNEYGSDVILQMLIITVGLYFFNQLFTVSLISVKKQNFLLITNSIGLVCNIILNLLFLPKFGIAVAAITTIFCEIIIFILLTNKMWKHFFSTYNLKQKIRKKYLKNFIFIFFINCILVLQILLLPKILENTLTSNKYNFIIIVFICVITYFNLVWIKRNDLLKV